MKLTDSGRYVHKDRCTKMLRAIVSDGKDVKQTKKCIVVYRADNKTELTIKNIETVPKLH